MGIIYGTCGHEVEWDTTTIMRRDWTRNGERCVSYVVYCEDCVEWVHQAGYYMETEEEAKEWMLEK